MTVRQGSQGSQALFDDWDRRLATDGLAALDVGEGLSSRGSGRVCGSGADVTPNDLAAQAARRQETAEIMSWRGEVLHTFAFPRARDRRIWELHAEGFGSKAIARRLHHDRETVRESIAATTTASKQRSKLRVDPQKAIRTAAPEFLGALWRALS